MTELDDSIRLAKATKQLAELVDKLLDRVLSLEIAVDKLKADDAALSNRIESLYTFVSSLNRPTVVP